MSGAFDAVKKAVSLPALLGVMGAARQGSGHWNPAPCCGHKGSLNIVPNTDEKVFKCHSCEAAGSVIDLAMKVWNLDEAGALKRLAADFNVPIEEAKDKKQKPLSVSEKLLCAAADFYHGLALNDPESPARVYFCKKRGHSEDTLRKMQVGFADGGLLSHLKGMDFTEEAVIATGLAVTKRATRTLTVPEDFYWRGLVLFPVIDHTGKVISFTSKDPSGKVKGLMLPGTKKNWFLNMEALGKSDELIVVEGQNDLASLFDVGCHNAIGTGGSPTGEQMRVLRNYLKKGVTVFACFDTDVTHDPSGKSGGPGFTRLLYREVMKTEATVKIIALPAGFKDIDEYLQAALRGGAVMNIAAGKVALKKLVAEALTPIQWEARQLERIDGAEARRKAAEERGLFSLVISIQRLSEKEIATDTLAKAIGISIEALEQELRAADNELRDKLIQTYSDPKKADANNMAEFIFNELSNGMGGRFYRTPEEKVCLFYKGLNYTIGSNLQFAAFFHAQTALNFAEKPGTTVLNILQSIAYTRGDFMETGNWIHTDLGKNRIYLNLSSPHQKIISLAAGESPQVLDNGTNEDGAMLTPSSQIKPFSYDPSAETGEGIKLFKRLVMDTVPTDKPQRYFLACWALSAFLLDYQKNKALLIINGPSGVGKSTAGANLTLLVCGQNLVGRGTGASATRIATNSPYSLFDNLENRNLKDATVDHLLLMANSSIKPKAKAGSDTEVMMQRLQSLCLITAIEPIPGRWHELINRTVVLTVAKEHWNTDFLDGEVEREILKYRDTILSAVFKMIAADVLPNIDRRKHWAQWMGRKFKGHPKERNNEHFTTMMVILEALLKYVPWRTETHIETQAEDLLTLWIAHQQQQARDTEMTSNEILTLLDDVAKIVTQRIKGANPALTIHKLFPNASVRVYYDLDLQFHFYQTEDDSLPFADAQGGGGKKFVIHGTAAEIFNMLTRHCAKGRRMPYENPTALASRLSNEFQIVQAGGWGFATKDAKAGAATSYNNPEHKFYCMVKGHRVWRLEKEIDDD